MKIKASEKLTFDHFALFYESFIPDSCKELNFELNFLRTILPKNGANHFSN